ncbi:MAG TPA: DUF418 domain-containing protein, partial [Chryseolinea sp.]
LDILRGIALLGILLITMPKFALPERYLETILQDADSLNFKVAYFTNIVLEGKMRALFSMIFGAGVILFIRDKEKSGKPVAGLFYSRMFWLAMFGLFHAHVLLSGGDILYLYALCGMILFFFRNTRPNLLLAAVVAITLLEMAMNTYFYERSRSQRMTYLEVQKIEQQGKVLNEDQLKAKTVWLEKENGYFPSKEKINSDIEIMRSGYWTIAEKMRPSLILKETKRVPFLMVDPLALMFLGMALFQWGFFTGQLHKKVYVWTLIVCYGIGFPIALYSWSNQTTSPNPLDFMESNPINIGIYIYPIQRILIALGHVSLIILLIRAGVFKRIFNALGAVGKMAFSNYILQTIICTLIFFGYGLGYFARFEYYQLNFIVVAIWVLQMIVSSLWLKHFRFGPLEWAWRSLTYRRLQSMAIPPHLRSAAP